MQEFEPVPERELQRVDCLPGLRARRDFEDVEPVQSLPVQRWVVTDMDDSKRMPATGIDAEDRWRDGERRMRSLRRGSRVAIVDPCLNERGLLPLVFDANSDVATRARKYHACATDDDARLGVNGRAGGHQGKAQDRPGAYR